MEDSPRVITMSETDNSKILRFDIDRCPEPDISATITQVLSVENTYQCFEYLPDRSADHFHLSAPALNLLNRTLPFLSRLSIDLGEFIGYSACWDTAYKKAKEKYLPHPYMQFPDIGATDIICAIANFSNVRHLTLHYRLQPDQVALMHPRVGCEVVRELFESFQEQKRGQTLIRFDLRFYTQSSSIFRSIDCPWYGDDSTISTTMSLAYNYHTTSRDGQQSKWKFTCDNPHYGKVLGRRRRAERLYGEIAWTYSLGGIQQNITQCRHKFVLRNTVMEALLWLAVLPSYLLFFENGKLARYEPSLADVELWSPWTRRKLYKGLFVMFLLRTCHHFSANSSMQ